MNQKNILIIQIAATYIGTVVGAGFASGLSILQFFTRFGAYGAIGILISTWLFIWLGIKMMILAHRIKAYSYQEFNNYLFGYRFGKIANVITFTILFGVTAVMLSGTGSIFEEELGLSSQLGIVLSLVLVFLVLTKQLKGILLVNSFVVPMMLFFMVILALKHAGAAELLQTDLWQHEQSSHWKWVISPFAYAALNFVTLLAVLVPLGCEAEEEGVLKWGGLWGGLGLSFMLLISHMSMNAYMPKIMAFDIPMAEVIQSFGPSLYILFIAVIYGEIFTTLIGNIFGMVRQMQSITRWPRNVILVFILGSTYLISQFGFSNLLSSLYNLFGYLGLLLIIYLAFERLPAKRKN